MPAKISEITMALAARLMDHLGIRTKPDVITGESHTSAQVYIFIIQEVALVESANLTENRSWNQHEHPANPVWRAILVVCPVLDRSFSEQCPGCDAERG